jgi:hypothetical protein
MLSAVLAIVTVAVALGQEPPKVVASFTSVEECAVVAAKANHQMADDLKAAGASLVCFKIVYPV